MGGQRRSGHADRDECDWDLGNYTYGHLDVISRYGTVLFSAIGPMSPQWLKSTWNVMAL